MHLFVPAVLETSSSATSSDQDLAHADLGSFVRHLQNALLAINAYLLHTAMLVYPPTTSSI